MARILAISSQVVFGPVGLSAIVPALNAQGHEVLAVPTVLLSNHPGHGPPAGSAIDIAALLNALEELGALKNVDAVLTGYFANAEQVNAATQIITKIESKIVLVDPVIGDHGRLYVKEDVAEAIRDQLLPLATITTPNAFELSWLRGEVITDFAVAARALKTDEVIVTSIPVDDQLATLRVTRTAVQWHHTQRHENVPNGTGDYFSGLYLARLLKMDRPQAFEQAMDALETAIEKSAGDRVLHVV
jgi:pyridoxine kinase